MNRTLLSVLSGLGGMIGWGTSDFFANTSSEKVGHSKTFFWSQIAGFLLITLFVLVTRPSFSFSPLFLLLTIFCGCAYAFGYLLFYKGFEIGNVSVVSAVINLQVIFVMGISFFIRHQTLTAIQIPAMISLLLGVLLVSVNFSDLKQGTVTLLKGVKETMVSAIIFGVLYWPLDEYIVEKYDWLAVAFITKLVAIIVVFALSTLRQQSMKIQKSTKQLWLLIGAVGILEAIGVLSATFGQSYGDGIIVAPISSALTVVTVSLAVIFLKEKISQIQALGIAMVILGIVLAAF